MCIRDRLKEKAHKAYITDLTIKSGSIVMMLHPRADINVDAIPELIGEERGRLKFVRGQNPKLVYNDEHAGYRGPEYMMEKAASIADRLLKPKP